MKFTIHLADPEETVIADVDARDRRAFEMQSRREFGRAADNPLRDVANSMPETYTFWLAWHAASTRGGLKLTWPEFDARAVHLETSGEDDELDPTNPGPTPG